MATNIEIIEGPSKYGLTDSLVEGDSSHRQELSFTILVKLKDDLSDDGSKVVQHTIKGFINELCREDGSSNNWRVKMLVTEAPDYVAKKNEIISFFYESHRRKGCFQL